MIRLVNIFRVRKSGKYILNPMGTFKGYGAYVDINPFRELESNVEPAALGSQIQDLLLLSGPTGYKLSEIKDYEKNNCDDETSRIQKSYFSSLNGKTASLNELFIKVFVEYADKSKSWKISSHRFVVEGDYFEIDKEFRIRLSLGIGALGSQVIELTKLD